MIVFARKHVERERERERERRYRKKRRSRRVENATLILPRGGQDRSRGGESGNRSWPKEEKGKKEKEKRHR